MRQSLLVLACCLAASFPTAALKYETPSPKPASPVAKPTTSRAATDRPVDACSLLDHKEIEAVTGSPVKEAKPERKEENGFVISQCYFALPVASDSLTLRLVQRGSGEDARDPRQVWEETFARDLKKAEKRKKNRPERVSNLGDEAFWMGGPEAGGLYVLKGNRHFRIGLGGEKNQARKIEKASKLARAILKRL